MRLGGQAPVQGGRNAAFGANPNGMPNMPSRGNLVVGVLAFLGLFMIVGTIMSFHSVEVTEYGLNYSLIRQVAEPVAFGPGRYWIGPFNHFVKFPATLRTIQFSDSKLQTDLGIGEHGDELLRSRTRDGLDVSIEISFQYQLKKDSIYKLYTTFGENAFHPAFVRIAVDRLTEIATSFAANEFFSNRNTIGKTMEKFLSAEFEERLYATIFSFQLRSVTLPPEFEDAIQETEVAQQDVKLAAMEQNSTNVAEETKVMQATRRTKVTLNMGDGEAKSLMLANKADITLYTAMQEKSADSYVEVLKDLDSNVDDFIGYMETRVVREHPSANTMLGIEVPDLGPSAK